MRLIATHRWKPPGPLDRAPRCPRSPRRAAAADLVDDAVTAEEEGRLAVAFAAGLVRLVLTARERPGFIPCS